MGLFDFLFGKKSSDEEPAPASPARPQTWKDRIAAAEQSDDFEWEWGNHGAHHIVHQVLKEAQPAFSSPERPAKIKELEDDENIDLRGTHQGSPIRFAIWMSFGNFWTIQMKVPQLGQLFDLSRDLEKVPKHGDADDPFDDDEDRRVFVAKGVFVQGDDERIEQGLRFWERLAEEAREKILAGMHAVNANEIHYAGDSIILHQEPGLPDLDDPVAYMKDCGDLLAVLRDAVADAGLIGEQEPPEGGLSGSRTKCGYCGSVWLMGPQHSVCPNCGAPAR